MKEAYYLIGGTLALGALIVIKGITCFTRNYLSGIYNQQNPNSNNHLNKLEKNVKD